MTDTRIVVQRFVDHFLAGRIVEGLSILNEDGVYTIIGTTPASGVYRGRQDLFDRLLPSLQTCAAPPVFTVSEIIVEKDRAVVLAFSNGEGPYGPYTQPHYAFVTRVAGDGFGEVIEFNDTVAIEKSLYGRNSSRRDGAWPKTGPSGAQTGCRERSSTHSLRITDDEDPVCLAPPLQPRLTEEEHDGHDWAHGLATTRRDA